ncbi:MAG: hypothetical protein Q7K42_03365 [Candidatus Diapherotrites archaeon]|nr:hypothetical protein [Candidatus Diapherotrites archaeon]
MVFTHKRIFSGILGIVGFLLSPLSWWNDLIVNVPLAWGFAFIFSFGSKEFFSIAFGIGYFLTNVLGLLLLHKGTQGFFGKNKIGLKSTLILSALYSVVAFALMNFALPKP